MRTKSKPPVPGYFHTHEIAHKYHGNGWVFVERVDDDLVHVVSNQVLYKDENGNLPRIIELKAVRMDLLSKATISITDPGTKEVKITDFPIHPPAAKFIQELQDELDIGARGIKNGFAVKLKGEPCQTN